MKSFTGKSYGVLFSLVLFICLSVNASTENLEVTNKVYKVTQVADENGTTKEKWVSPDNVIPGNQLIYVTTIKNTSTEVVSNVVVTNPIPNNSRYIDESAESADADVFYSLDGDEYKTPDQLMVQETDGSVRLATAKEYTHVRWIYRKNINPNSEGTVVYRTFLGQ